MEKKQRYLCKSCGRRFVQDDGFVRMVYPKEIIAEAISLYDRGEPGDHRGEEVGW